MGHIATVKRSIITPPLTDPIRVKTPNRSEIPIASSPPTTRYSATGFPARLLKKAANGLPATDAPLRNPLVALFPASKVWTFPIPLQRNRNPSAIRPMNIDHAFPDFNSFPNTSLDHVGMRYRGFVAPIVGYAPIRPHLGTPTRTGAQSPDSHTVRRSIYPVNIPGSTRGSAGGAASSTRPSDAPERLNP